MSSIALARLWRPKKFSELIGQEPITKALTNALNHQRLHHAYLFTGTRGVGKTSVARLLAKALNCEHGISAQPCLQCDTCIAIEKNQFVDLIEIDAASRTRVEDTREMLENVHYAPTLGRFKIYLIDEVHMLSTHSFNALLKTLEEPPAHVKFLLATTDPQKLPVTVLSRCLQFHLRHLESSLIVKHLEHVLTHESRHYELKALELLATAANGSMRDALSLLDQAIAYSDDAIKTTDIQAILGHTQQNYALQLLHAIAHEDPNEILSICRKIGEEGGHFRYVMECILSLLHQITITQQLNQPNPWFALHEDLDCLTQQIAPEDVQLFYHIGIQSLNDMQLAPSLAMGFEMALFRMYTFKPQSITTTPTLTHEKTSNHAVDKAIVKTPNIEWNKLIIDLNLTGLTKNAAEQAEWVEKNNGIVILRIEKNHRSIFTPSIITRIEQALSKHYQEPIKLNLRLEASTLATPAQNQIEQKKQDKNAANLAIKEDKTFEKLNHLFPETWSVEPLN